MNCKTKILKFSPNDVVFTFFVILLHQISCPAFAQESNSVSGNNSQNTFNIKDESFFLPLHQPNKKYAQAIAIYYVVPPKDWTLDIVKAPFFNYSGKYALPEGFNLQGDVSTIFVSTRAAAGPFWNYSADNLHLGLGFQEAFNYGILNQFGFATILTGWEQQPSVIVGYSFQNTAAIVRGDFYYTSAINLSQEGYVVSAPQSFVNGFSVTGRYEQRLHKNQLMSLGLKINYVKYHIIAWPALPVNQYRYAVPEFQICLIL